MPQFEHNSEKFGYINLESLAGVQKALTSLGHDAGAADGKDGPATQKAVREFQASLSIKIDGIVGPQTRQSLMDELQAKSTESTAPSV